MELLSTVAGVVLILLGIADVFFTVLHYDGFGFLSSRLYNSLFDLVRALTRPLPRRYRALGLSMAAPLMVPATITVWILLISLGYALVYYESIDAKTFYFSSPGLKPSFLEALYLSGTAISTVGFGDITPLSTHYQLLTISESLLGFGVLTLAITYVLGVYGVLQQLGVLAAGVHHQTQDTDNPWSMLAPHFQGGEPVALDAHLMELHRGLVELYEGVRRYPVVYYYHSRRAYRSVPYIFRMIGGAAGALRWGLPISHPATQTPWLPTLMTGLLENVAFVERSFLSKRLEDAPEPVSFETFEKAMTGEETPDWLSQRFFEMQTWMHELAQLGEPPNVKDAYRRYLEWLPYTHRVRVFFEASAKDLGYELEDLAQTPGERMF